MWYTTLALVALFFTFYTTIALSLSGWLYMRMTWGKQPVWYWIPALLMIAAYTIMEKTHAAIRLDSLF